MSSPIKAVLASCLVLGPLTAACARPPLHVRTPHPQRQPQIVIRRGPQIVVGRRPPPIHRSPVGGGNHASNGITTREVFLWARPAKIEPHIREVPNGRPVQVVGSADGFYAVIMHDGLRGWMPRDAVRPR